MEPINPLNYDFGTLTRVYKMIHNQAVNAGLYIHWNGTSQTLQLFVYEASYNNKEKYIGAIQYEGSNHFAKKAPTIVSWRFKRANIHSYLIEALEEITDYMQDKNKGPNVDPSAESISFKFSSFNDEVEETILKIGKTIENHIISSLIED
jgi:hypothetical protein